MSIAEMERHQFVALVDAEARSCVSCTDGALCEVHSTCLELFAEVERLRPIADEYDQWVWDWNRVLESL